MVRRPPRSTLTHSFPTRRSSDLRCGGEGLVQVARRELQALLPFTGEGARRADEGARAQLSVPSLSRGQALLPLRRRRAVSGSAAKHGRRPSRSEEHTSELQSLMRISYADFCLKKKITERTRTRMK